MKYRQAYLMRSRGIECPFCGTDGDGAGGPVSVDNGKAVQEMSCNNCDGVWEDVYILADAVAREDE